MVDKTTKTEDELLMVGSSLQDAFKLKARKPLVSKKPKITM